MTKKIKHEFVKNIPDHIQDNTLYISIDYTAVIHKCFCGCGNEVNTPLSPTDWKLIYDGKHVSLYPSVGNWNLKCRSHYWIENNNIYWAENWSDTKVAVAQRFDYISKQDFYRKNMHAGELSKKVHKHISILEKFKNWMREI